MTQVALEVRIDLGSDAAVVDGELTVPGGAFGVVVFVHGSGSSRHSPRNRFVAEKLQEAGIATLLMDLLTAEEERVDQRTRHLRFDIGLLAGRVAGARRWLANQGAVADLPVGYFGASTGAAAALVAAAIGPEQVAGVVSRGGRPDLAGDDLARVTAPTLLIVGALDHPVIELNREAAARLQIEHQLEIVPGATHLFEEPGTLDVVVQLAIEWFRRQFRPASS